MKMPDRLLPGVPPDNRPNGACVNSELLCQHPRRIRSTDPSYFGHVEIRKHRSRMTASGSGSTLVLHVLRVVRRCAGEYVIRVATSRVIARVTSECIRLYGSVLRDVSNSVSAKCNKPSVNPRAHPSVVSSVTTTPRPTILRTTDINRRPESIKDSLRYFFSCKILGLHDLASLSGWGLSRTGGATTPPGSCYQGLYSYAQ
jgi:hypothetical protein